MIAETIHLPDGNYLSVAVTDEGIIIDAYEPAGRLVGTNAMTFAEWYDRLAKL